MNSYEALNYQMCTYCSMEVPEYMMVDGKCRQCREYLESDCIKDTCQCGNKKPEDEKLCLHCWCQSRNMSCTCGCEQ